MKDPNVRHVGEASATDTRLLRAALDQDQAAWRDLVHSYGGRVYRWIRQAGLQEIDAAEVANQVFVSVARALPEYRRGEASGSFRKWLRTITYNAVTDWFRVQQKQVCRATGGSDNRTMLQNHAMSSLASTEGILEISAEQAAMERVRQRTDPGVWRVFWLVTAEQMTPEEVAAECGVARSTVYVTKHRLEKAIRRELARGVGQNASSEASRGNHERNGPMS